MESARRARPEDLDALVALVQESHVELGRERGGVLWVAHAEPATRERFVATCADPRALVLAGTYDDVVFGVCVARLVDAPGHGTVATIGDLYVHPDAREVGVGAALVEAVVTWARDTGCVGVDATVLPGTREAKNFFEAHGLVARAIVVHRALGEGPP